MDSMGLIGSKARLKILRELSEEDKYVTEIMDIVGMDGTTAKHHLDRLESAGIVSTYKNGRRKYYSLERDIIVQISSPPQRQFVIQFPDSQ